MKKTCAVLYVLCLGIFLVAAAPASDDVREAEAALPSGAEADDLIEPAEQTAPEPPVAPDLDEGSLSDPVPAAWNPPPDECIPLLACSIPQDCPGGTCYEYNTTYHYRHCICAPLG